jgi:hypothetical protein
MYFSARVPHVAEGGAALINAKMATWLPHVGKGVLLQLTLRLPHSMGGGVVLLQFNAKVATCGRDGFLFYFSSKSFVVSVCGFSHSSSEYLKGFRGIMGFQSVNEK